MDADQRIDDLEERLCQYHDWLVEAIADRDRLALDAAWGVHYALYSSLATVVVLGGAYIAFDQRSWIIGLCVGVALLVPQFVIHAWSNGERMKEVERFATLPTWEYRGR